MDDLRTAYEIAAAREWQAKLEGNKEDIAAAKKIRKEAQLAWEESRRQLAYAKGKRPKQRFHFSMDTFKPKEFYIYTPSGKSGSEKKRAEFRRLAKGIVPAKQTGRVGRGRQGVDWLSTKEA